MVCAQPPLDDEEVSIKIETVGTGGHSTTALLLLTEAVGRAKALCLEEEGGHKDEDDGD